MLQWLQIVFLTALPEYCQTEQSESPVWAPQAGYSLEGRYCYF